MEKCPGTLMFYTTICPGTLMFYTTICPGTLMFYTTESIRNTIDDGKFGCGVFIDLKKAFDTVIKPFYSSKQNGTLWYQRYCS